VPPSLARSDSCMCGGTMPERTLTRTFSNACLARTHHARLARRDRILPARTTGGRAHAGIEQVRSRTERALPQLRWRVLLRCSHATHDRRARTNDYRVTSCALLPGASSSVRVFIPYYAANSFVGPSRFAHPPPLVATALPRRRLIPWTMIARCGRTSRFAALTHCCRIIPRMRLLP